MRAVLRSRRLARAIGLVLLAGSVAACTAEPDATDDAVNTATIAPTTSLVIEFIDATGLPYCEVAKEVAPAIRVFSDSSSNYGDADTVENTYVEALRAFDALQQVSQREIADDLVVLDRTVADAVRAASVAGWDLTLVTDDAGSGVRSDQMTHALAHVRQYTQERCGLDVVGIEPPITVGPVETPMQRLTRVIAETFPALTDEQIACVASGLPGDWDPASPELDQDVAAKALTSCGINPDAPGASTTSTSTSSSVPPKQG